MEIKLSSFLWIILAMISSLILTAQPNYPTQPEQAQVIYVDLEHFVDAMKNFSIERDSIQVLNDYYFDKASIGLKEFIGRHQLTPELLLDAIQLNPETYEQIVSFLNEIDEIKAIYRESLKKYHQVLPNAIFPPTYLLVGANRGIAQASQVGQLVTITRTMDNKEKLIRVTVHELTHFQQVMTLGVEKYISLYREPNNMLGLCMREGGAEFITSLVMGKITQEKARMYLEENELEMKERFLADLKMQDSTFWLWESLNQKEYPILLGYAMGYKICESYYNNQSVQEEALAGILMMGQPESFLEQSGYFPK